MLAMRLRGRALRLAPQLAGRMRRCSSQRLSTTRCAAPPQPAAPPASRAPPVVLRVKEPTVLEMALSTELISATASVPLAFVGYGPLCSALGVLLHSEAPSTELVGYFTTVTGLLFGFGLSNTFYFLYSQQQELYETIYREASAVNRLLEEAECALAPADVAVLAYETRRFLTDGAWSHQGDIPPAEVLAAEINADDDAVENIIRYVIGCTPAGGLDMNDTTRCLRDASVARLAASQCKVPAVQFFVCKVLAAMVLAVFPLLHVGAGTDLVLSGMEAVLFSTLCGIVILFLCIVDDLADTNNGLYSVTPVRATLQAALLAKVETMLARAPQR